MAEEFPEDSLFRNSNVALLEAVLEKKKDVAPLIPPKEGGDIFPQSASQFMTAKQLLISRGSSTLSKTKHSEVSGTSDETLLSPSKSSISLKLDDISNKIVLKPFGKKSGKKYDKSSKCDGDEASHRVSTHQKPDKDKSKNSYRPLSITRSVVLSSKPSNTLCDTFSPSSQAFSLQLSSDGLDEESEGSSSSLLSTQHKLKLDTWGLPDSILKQYARKGITEMFPWQVECLCCPRVLRGGNLVYSAPTSAGKTLVSEIVCIKTILERQKKVLFVLPFVSVVREKMFYFQEIFRGSRVRVDGYMGDHSAQGGFKSLDLAVCTIEKANSLINRLMEEKELVNLGAVVVDELHLLGDSHRGYLLELLLTKLKYMSLRNSDISIQLVGMSATLPNLSLLSTWLNADLYKTAYRPVPLEEFVKIGNTIYSSNMKPVRTIIPELIIKNDTEDIVYLCVETIAEGHSVLIFCPTKSWCESLAKTIASEFQTIGLSRDINAPESLAYKLRDQLNPNKISECLEHLRNCPVGLDSLLGKMVSFAVAYHHAGLSMDERDIIEGSFKNGTLRVLVATSTLSSGVNLPARRVIIRSPAFQGRPIDILSYRQMVGRAGRMGVDSAGESILICQKTEQRIVSNLLCSDLKPIQSCLGVGDLSASLKRAILEVIASGVASTPEDLQLYTSCTLLAIEKQTESTTNPVSSCIDFLQDNELIRLQTGDDKVLRYIPTPLGQACLSASLHPDEGLRLFKELQRARQCFVLENELHLIYQVTPFSVADQWGNLDWLQVLAMWEQLTPDMKRVGELVGVEDRFIVRAMRGTINLKLEKQCQKLMIHRRFYTALALHDLVNEIPLNTVAAKFNCSRGMLQSLQQSAATYAGMVTSFCRRLGWSTVELIINQFQDRLHFGTQRELLDLLRLPSLNGPRARALYDAGVTSLSDLATADILLVENALHSSAPFLSDKGRDDETTSEAERRRKLRGIWVTGRQGLSEREAAELLISEARSIIQGELGLCEMNWSQNKQGEPNKSLVVPSTGSNSIQEICDDNVVHSVQVSKHTKNTENNAARSQIARNTKTKADIDESSSSPYQKLVMEMKADIDSGGSESVQVKIDKTLSEESCNNIEDIRAQKNLEETNSSLQSPSISLLNSSNNFLDNNICDVSNLNESHESNQSTLRSSVIPEGQKCANVVPDTAEDNVKQNSLDNLFDSSFSNSIFARLDKNVANVFEKDKNLKQSKVHSSDLTLSTGLDTYPPSWGISNSALDNLCLQEEHNAQLEQNDSRKLDSSIKPSSRNRLSSDLFETSPHQCQPVSVVSPQGQPRKESEDLFCSFVTPTTDRVLRPRNRSGNSSNSKKKRDLLSPLLVGNTSRSPSLFGDSFEMNTGLLEVLDGDHVRGEENSDAVELHSSTKLDDSKTMIFEADNNVANTSTSSSDSNAGNSQSKVGRKRRSEMNSKVSGSAKDLTYTLRERLVKNSQDSETITNPKKKSVHNSKAQRGPTLHLGLSRRGIVGRSKTKKNVVTEVLTDSFLETAFQTAFVNYETSNAFSPSKDNDVDAKETNFNAGSEDSSVKMYDKKRMKESESSDEDIIISSPEDMSKKTARNIGFISLPSSKQTEFKQNLKPKQRTLNMNFIGPPQTRSMLAARQSCSKSGVDNVKDLQETTLSNYTCLEKEKKFNEIINLFLAKRVNDWDHFTIIDVGQNNDVFGRFSQKLMKSVLWAVSFACECSQEKESAVTIGSKVLRLTKSHKQPKSNNYSQFVYGDSTLVGVSFCFGGPHAYYVSLAMESNDCVVPLATRLQLLKSVFTGCMRESVSTVCCFDVKEQYKMFIRCTGIKICSVSIFDPKVGDWLLEPEGKERNLKAMVVKYADKAVGFAEHVGNVGVGLGSVALDISLTVSGRQRSAVEAVLCFEIMGSQCNKLHEAGLFKCFTSVEMPVVFCVADMELAGIGFNAGTLRFLQEKLQVEMSILEAKAYQLAKRPFSLLSPTDTAKVLYQELKLGQSYSLKGRFRNTSKETLEKLRSEHPLPAVILLWRKINAIYSKTVCPLLPTNQCTRLFGQYQMRTATGRISMHEPNIQCIPRDFDILSEHKEVFSMRKAFVASPGCALIAADYSQLELRLLAYLSRDSKLREVLNCGQDVFSNLAASWNNIVPDQVTDDLRQKAKQLCYGIIYGMGARALANNLGVEEPEALSLMESFHEAFPCVREYLSQTVLLCREHGYVKTLFGRRRYLPGITSKNPHVKAHAERQAVNTTIQGSAADLTKTAMIAVERDIHRHFSQCSAGNNFSINMPRLVLHLHDELMYEVPQKLETQFCEIIKRGMENAIVVSMKFPVKVKVGKSWGELQLYPDV